MVDGYNGYNYKCVDPTNGKIEWANTNESDGTRDNSPMTSVLTDGLIATSPSLVAEVEVHQNRKPVTCGTRIRVARGQSFDCWDPSDNVFKSCWGIGNNNY